MGIEFPEEFLARLKKVTSKRPRTVIDHIIQHGFITTEELKNLYGYDHPPRAARDVREQGIPLETFRVKSADGRIIAAYKFGDLSAVVNDRLHGRKIFSKSFKKILLELQGGKCAVCASDFEERYLQIDHKIPYEVAGDAHEDRDPEDYMLLCSSCNRAKSWSCEQCSNWKQTKDISLCKKCFWASPIEYEHVALLNSRQANITWLGQEVCNYDKLMKKAQNANIPIPEYIKKVLKSLDE